MMISTLRVVTIVRLPVPRYYWKILHSPSLSAGVAVVGVNNPHLTVIIITSPSPHIISLR